MTTSRSPLRKIKEQADKIAAMLKAAERGDPPTSDAMAKMGAARKKESLKIAVVMDDKLLTIELLWTTIASSTEGGISEFLIKKMRESRDTIH